MVGGENMVDNYSVRVYCSQCETNQIMRVPKGKPKDVAEDMKCPNCGIAGEIELNY